MMGNSCVQRQKKEFCRLLEYGWHRLSVQAKLFQLLGWHILSAFTLHQLFCNQSTCHTLNRIIICCIHSLFIFFITPYVTMSPILNRKIPAFPGIVEN